MEASKGDTEVQPNPKAVEDAALTAMARNLLPEFLAVWEAMNTARFLGNLDTELDDVLDALNAKASEALP